MIKSKFEQIYISILNEEYNKDLEKISSSKTEPAETSNLMKVSFLTSDQALIDALNSGFESISIFTNAKDEETGEDTVVEVKFGKDSFGNLEVTAETEEINECDECGDECTDEEADEEADECADEEADECDECGDEYTDEEADEEADECADEEADECDECGDDCVKESFDSIYAKIIRDDINKDHACDCGKKNCNCKTEKNQDDEDFEGFDEECKDDEENCECGDE
jgi:hypothetical protein